MSTGSENQESDKLTSFCGDCISRNPGAWPISEEDLAKEFIKYFEIPPLIQITDLIKLCSATNIELSKEELPRDILGLNASLGYKRQIVYSGRSEDNFVQEHTILHEIREIIEYIFTKLGFPTVEPNEIEYHANSFASFVMAFGPQNEFKTWIENALQIESTWWRAGAVLLVGFCTFSLLARAHLSAIYPSS